MNETDKAYLAGIIDGEGSILLSKYHKSEYPSPCIKKEKARVNHIITSYKEVTIRNGKYNDEQKQAKEQFYIEFMAL